MIARMGGEEFAALLPGVDARCAVALAEALRGAFAEIAEYCGNKQIYATVSIGVAASIATTHDISDIDALMRQADAALYAAKRAGRNRVKLLELEDIAPLATARAGTPAAA